VSELTECDGESRREYAKRELAQYGIERSLPMRGKDWILKQSVAC